MNARNNAPHSDRQEKLLAARKVVEDSPDCAASWIQLGLLLSQFEDRQGAIRAFDKALGIDPDNKYARARRDMLATHPDAVTQVKRNYAFASAREVRSNQWIIRSLTTAAVIAGLFFLLKFTVLTGTRRVVVNDDNNSFPIFSRENQVFGYSSIPGNPMYFRSFTGGRFHIANSPGGQAHPFNPNGKPSRDDQDSQFCFSHDATRVAFTRQRVIHTARRDGSDLRTLGEGHSPQWSPVDEQIAFIGPDPSNPNTYADSLILADISSDSRIILSDSISDSFSWSPSGGAIAFVSESHDRSSLEVMQFENPNDGMMDEDTSSDGESMDPFRQDDDFYVSPYRISIVDVMTRNVTELPDAGNFSHPIWMPDRSGILYFSIQSTCAEIHIAKPDGSQDRTLYNAGHRIMAPGSMSVSSDSKWIVFEALVGGATDTETVEVPEAYRGFTGAPTMETGGRTFSPDLFAARTDGSDCHRLTNMHDSKSSPIFQPGTHWVYYHTIPIGGKVQIWKTKVK